MDSLKEKHKVSALGAGTGMDNELIEAPEDEEGFDLMNDETFGDNMDGDFDWEEEHERLAEVEDHSIHKLSTKGGDSGYIASEPSYRSQEEDMEHSINQLMIDDDIEDDPAIVNITKAKTIPKRAKDLSELFGPSSPPSFLDTEHLVSPTAKNIWGSPTKEASFPPPPQNKLQSLFNFSKEQGLAPNTHIKESAFPPAPGKTPMGLKQSKTLEELEQELMGESARPPRVAKGVTAEDLEREMMGEARVPQGPPPPAPPHLPSGVRLPFPFPPGMMQGPPPGSPGVFMGSAPNRGIGTVSSIPAPNGRHSPHMEVAGTPPGRPNPMMTPSSAGRRSPMDMHQRMGSTPSGPGFPHPHQRQSPLSVLHGISPVGRMTPSPPPIPTGSPLSNASFQARLLAFHSSMGTSVLDLMAGNRPPSQPIGIPRGMLPNRGGLNNNSPGSMPYHSPGNMPYHSPSSGPFPNHVNHSPGPRMQFHSPSNEKMFRGRGRGYSVNNSRGYYHNQGDRDYECSRGEIRRGDPRNMNPDRRNYQEYRNNPNANVVNSGGRRYYQYNAGIEHQNVDKYAGLMSQKEKDWIIKIQLLQLQTDNPYLDDFYYTTYTLKRKIAERHKQIENGLDTKDSDPELIIPSLGKMECKAYRPAQFEGSLGRLTTSSVHNPRQIIDVQSNNPTEDGECKKTKESRKSRQLFLEIERGYDLLLEADDLEKRSLALPEDTRVPLFEHRHKILRTLHEYVIGDWNTDHFLSLMSVRKGRKLVSRICKELGKEGQEDVVQIILKNIQSLLRKDQKEEGLMILHDQVISVISHCDLKSLVKLARILQSEEAHQHAKSVALAIQNKFGSSVMCSLLNRGEVLFNETSPLDMDNQLQSAWCTFVQDFAAVLAVVPKESLVHPQLPASNINNHLDRVLNKKLIAVVEDKIRLFTEPAR